MILTTTLTIHFIVSQLPPETLCTQPEVNLCNRFLSAQTYTTTTGTLETCLLEIWQSRLYRRSIFRANMADVQEESGIVNEAWRKRLSKPERSKRNLYAFQ